MEYFDLIRFLKFLLVGAISAIVDIGAFWLLLDWKLSLQVSATVSFISGLIVNFSLHSFYTFSSKIDIPKAIKFIAVVAINYAISIFFVYFFVYCSLSPLMGKIFSLPVIAINGFMLSRGWVYRDGDSSK